MIENADYWIGALAGAAVLMWPSLLTLREKHYTQTELTRISSEYSRINFSFLVHTLLMLFLAVLLVILPLSTIRKDDAEYVRVVISVWPTVFFSCLGFAQGLFAVRKGVYPTSLKFYGAKTTYVYSEDDRGRRLGRQQIYSAVAVIVIAILVGLVRWWLVH